MVARLNRDPWKKVIWPIFSPFQTISGIIFFGQIYFWPRIDINDPKEFNDPQLFDDSSYSMIPSYSMINWKYGLW